MAYRSMKARQGKATVNVSSHDQGTLSSSSATKRSILSRLWQKSSENTGNNDNPAASEVFIDLPRELWYGQSAPCLLYIRKLEDESPSATSYEVGLRMGPSGLERDFYLQHPD